MTFRNMEEYKDFVMRNPSFSDIEKLQRIFSVSKEEVKRNDPQLYYAILGVLDGAKIGAKKSV